MSNQYLFIKKLSELYNILEDDLSRKLFWARMKYDVTPSIESAINFFGIASDMNKDELEQQYNWKETFKEITSKGGKIFLYGAGTCGRGIAELILNAGGDFYGFCDKNAATYTNGLLGKSVFLPEVIYENPDNSYVIITTIDYYKEIYNILIQNGIKKDNILKFLGNENFAEISQSQYFEYPELFVKGTAFVDGGCYNCDDCEKFAKWCNNEYSKIFAFEPDRINFEKCLGISKKKKIDNLELIQAGLGKENTTIMFATAGGTESRTVDVADLNNRNFDYVNFDLATTEEVKIQTLDSVVAENTIGFIKLDIEGEELNALYGAEKTLLRDKPLLAICLYHRQGDMLAIMDYLHELIPEYHFCLRHYSTLSYDTILYASTQLFPIIKED